MTSRNSPHPISSDSLSSAGLTSPERSPPPSKQPLARRDSLYDLYGIAAQEEEDKEAHPFEAEIRQRLATQYDEEEDRLDAAKDIEAEADEAVVDDGPLSLPPVDLRYDTAQDAFAYILNWSRSRGYGLRKSAGGKSNKDSTPYRWHIECDKAERPNSKATHREGGSKGVACGMLIVIQQYRSQGGFYALRVARGHSEHEASPSPDAHPYHRRPTSKEEAIIDSQSRSGISPKLILEHIHEFNKKNGRKSFIKASDVYNIRYRLRAEKLQGLKPI